MSASVHAADSSSSAPEPAHHASGRVMVDGGLALHFLDYGGTGGRPMLCVHGGAAHAHWFDFVAGDFSADHHVRAIDLRGHGDSAWADPPDYSYGRFARDLDEAVRALDLHDLVLVGHSMGGMVSLLYAATYPGRVARLVIVDSTMRMTEERIARLRDVGERKGSTYQSREDFITRYKLRPEGSRARPEVIRHLAGHGAREQPDGQWRHKFDRNVYSRRESIDGLPKWNSISVPALVVKGGLSPRLTPEILADIRARCPQVEFAEVPDSEHHVTLDNPRGFSQVLRRFLSRQ